MKKKYLSCILICLIVFLILKTLHSNKLFINSTYGMESLIQTGSIDNLYIGSSMFRQGLDIIELQKNFPQESHYILSYNGNQPIWEYMQLEYLLKNDVKIGTLYIDMYAYSLCKEPALDDEKMFLEFSYEFKKKIFYNIKNNISWSEQWQLWISSCNEMIFFWPIYSYIVNSQFQYGGTLFYSAGNTNEILNSMSTSIYPTEINSLQEKYICEIIDLAYEEEIEIVFVETPKYYKIQFDQAYCDLMDNYKKLLAKMDVKVISVDEEIDYYDSSLFQDLIHLSSKGRKLFSQILCNKLRMEEE